MTLTAQQHQGLHGEGVVFALASSAGLLVSRPSLDVDGVDWSIGFPGAFGCVRSPKIEVQVKTWSGARGTEEPLRCRMRVRHFKALAGPGFAVPRFLVLMVVPEDPTEYASCRVRSICFRHAAYWVSLADRSVLPEGANEAQTVVVPVPRPNVLTPEALRVLVAGEETKT